MRQKLFILLALYGELALAIGEQSTSLGSVAGNLSDSADILAKVMWAACVIVGIALLVTAFTQFQAHRENPKLVPLLNPIIYLVLSIVSIAIPFGERIMGWMDGYTQEDQRVEREYKSSVLDLDEPVE